MKQLFLPIALISGFLFTSCSNDDDGGSQSGNVEAPATYTFERNGASTVNYSGQTTRLEMGEALLEAFKNTSLTATTLKSMYAHVEGASDFEDADLNASGKNLRSKTAASADFFGANAAGQAEVQADFDAYIEGQVNEVFPRWNNAAAAGVAGQIADGSSTRYVNSKGLEYNQLFNKGMIGAVMTDQALNNYLSATVLDAGNNRQDNAQGITVEGKNYTQMEHKWDEAYGYVFGLNADPANPNADLGADSFLNKYLGRMEGDPDFAGISETIYEAFKLGRAAIVAGDYELRDAQAEIIREKISEVIGVRAVYYLEAGKAGLQEVQPSYGTVFHDLSEGYGFIYSLQFTRKPGTQEPYFSRAEVEGFLQDMMDDGPNGLWDVTPETLGSIAAEIAARFDFTVTQAAQ